MKVENSPSAALIAPLMLRNLVTSVFMFADKPLIFLAEKNKFLEVLRYILVSVFLFLLRVLPSLFPSLIPYGENYDYSLTKPRKGYEKGLHVYATTGNAGDTDTGIARALSQLLSLVNDIPVSSRKYEVVRSLAEKQIDDNLLVGNAELREINCRVLAAAFGRTLGQLEAAIYEIGDLPLGVNDDYLYKLGRIVKGVKYYGDVLWQRGMGRDGELMRGKGSSAEKLAAELLWLVEKMAACGCTEEAVCKWASATNLAWIALSADSRVQGSLIKVSAFLIKEVKNMQRDEEDTIASKDQLRRTKMNMLMSWMPLLCRGSNGTDAPVLSISERAELEKSLEEIIETLELEDEQEQVLSLWLHHFTYCANSDWPNLQKCYTKWCNTSRRLVILQ